MIISVWRYSHLSLAVSSFLLLIIAAVTGIILAFEPVVEQSKPYKAQGFEQVTLAQTIPLLKAKYPNIQELSVNEYEHVIMAYTDDQGHDQKAYINPVSGDMMGTPQKKKAIFEWATDLHRSLFLHETGRALAGIASLLLILIAASGTILIIQRQRGIKRFFSSIEKTGFAQYYHAVFGRLSLPFILAIALTGTYLSVSRFIIKPQKAHAVVNTDNIKEEPQIKPADFVVFKQTKLSAVQTVQFPFSDFPEDYFTLKLQDRESCVNQFTGELLAEQVYSKAYQFNSWNLKWHTGRSNPVWAIILAISSAYILFFIYSGFVVTFKRKANTIRNKYLADESHIIILVGSENGTSYQFAASVYKQLLKQGQKVFLTDMDRYTIYPQATHLLIMTSTYGLGDPPSNAHHFTAKLKKHTQVQQIQFSVLGFGSRSYPQFCQFAYDVDELLRKQEWAVTQMKVYAVDDRSPQDFSDWLTAWSALNSFPLMITRELLTVSQPTLKKLVVTGKTGTDSEGAFIMQLKTKGFSKFTSGDLLAIYPKNDHRERLYSVGKVNGQVQLSIKLHQQGLGSSFLYALNVGDNIQARIIKNQHFHFPKKARAVVMICNGTGIAPFSGMLSENKRQIPCYLYCGFRNQSSFELYEPSLKEHISKGQLQACHLALSRENEKQYVSDLLKRDSSALMQLLTDGAVVMICGSLSMQKDVLEWLDNICLANNSDMAGYKEKGQLLTDCY